MKMRICAIATGLLVLLGAGRLLSQSRDALKQNKATASTKEAKSLDEIRANLKSRKESGNDLGKQDVAPGGFGIESLPGSPQGGMGPGGPGYGGYGGEGAGGMASEGSEGGSRGGSNGPGWDGGYGPGGGYGSPVGYGTGPEDGAFVLLTSEKQKLISLIQRLRGQLKSKKHNREEVESQLRNALSDYFQMDMEDRVREFDKVKARIAEMEAKLQLRLDRQKEIVDLQALKILHKADGLELIIPSDDSGYGGGMNAPPAGFGEGIGRGGVGGPAGLPSGPAVGPGDEDPFK